MLLLHCATPWRPAALTALAPCHRAPRAAAVAPRPAQTRLPCRRRGAGAVCAAARPGAGTETPGRDFASSLALMVLGAALVSERVNGYGLIAQLELDFPGIQPLLLGVAALLAVAAVWPARRKAQDAVELVRQLAGRAAFGGLSAALAAEVWAGKGLLALLEVETGAQALSESEVILAALLLLVLTGPRKTSSA